MLNKNLFKKTAIVLSALVLAGSAVFPVYAKSDNGRDLPMAIKNFQRSVENSILKNFRDDSLPVSAGVFFDGSALKSARSAYKLAIKNANETYRSARQSAHSKFVLALNSSPDQDSRFSAFKTYMADLLAAIKQRDSAKQTALQVFIDAISGIHIK